MFIRSKWWLGDTASVMQMAEKLAGVAIDMVINNAGMAGPAFDQQNTYAMDYDGWAETFNVNSIGPVRVLQALEYRISGSPRRAR